MSDLQELQNHIAKMTPDQQYLIQDCAHQVQQVLDRYKDALIAACGVNLASIKLQETIKY